VKFGQNYKSHDLSLNDELWLFCNFLQKLNLVIIYFHELSDINYGQEYDNNHV
jgi:hypothetical protein